MDIIRGRLIYYDHYDIYDHHDICDHHDIYDHHDDESGAWTSLEMNYYKYDRNEDKKMIKATPI